MLPDNKQTLIRLLMESFVKMSNVKPQHTRYRGRGHLDSSVLHGHTPHTYVNTSDVGSYEQKTLYLEGKIAGKRARTDSKYRMTSFLTHASSHMTISLCVVMLSISYYVAYRQRLAARLYFVVAHRLLLSCLEFIFLFFCHQTRRNLKLFCHQTRVT